MSRESRSGLFLFAVSLLVIWESLRVELGSFVEPGTGFLSFFIGLALCGLSLGLVWRGRGVKDPKKPIALRVIWALLSLFVYSLVMETVGFVISTFFLVAVLFHLGQPRRWWMLIGMSGVVTFLAYLVFGIFLQVYFPRGIFGI